MGNKKIRRKRQRSLFSMTSAGEYSLLDSGRISSGFDPMGLAHASRSSPGGPPFNANGDSREPPSLDLLAEMIKEEIRQASNLKQALERVTSETASISRRMSCLSVSDAATCSESALEHPGSAQPPGFDRRPKKQVQFVVPDDVRFRWLGIFQQPAGSDSGSDDEVPTPCPESPPVTCPAPEGGRLDTADSHAEHKPSPPEEAPACARSGSDSSSSDSSSSSAQRKEADDAATDPGAADGAAASSGGPAVQARPSDPSPPLPLPPAGPGAMTNGSSTPEHSSVLTESDSGLSPFTANSSVEAVYGGSRSDTREPSVLQSAQINAARRLAENSTAAPEASAKRKHVPWSAKESSDDPSRSRLKHLLADSPPTSLSSGSDGDGNKDAAVPVVNGALATISSRASRRLASHPAMPTQPPDQERMDFLDHVTTDDRSEIPPFSKTVGRSTGPGNPFPGRLRTGASSAFSQPTPATSRAAAPKRYSVLPPFTPPADASHSRPAQADGTDLERSRPPQVLSRSGSSQLATASPVALSSSQRRRNSFDGSSIPGRSAGLAAGAQADEAAAEADDPDGAHIPTRADQPPGLLRRVTLASAQRKHISHHHHHINLHGEEAGGKGGLGGTWDYFRHRLRARTHSSSLHAECVADSAVVDARGSVAEMRGGADGAGVPMTRPRRRSDAEVKTRNGEQVLPPPPPPAIPEQFQHRYQSTKNGVARDNNAKVDSLQLLHAPRSSIAGSVQSDWVAISPPPADPRATSPVADPRATSPTPNALAHRQRRSHDEGMRPDAHYTNGRAHAAGQAGGKPRHPQRRSFGTSPEPHSTLTKDQLELIRLHPVRANGKAPAPGGIGPRYNSGDVSSVPPQQKSSLAGGRSSIERLEPQPAPRATSPVPAASSGLPLSPLAAENYAKPAPKPVSAADDGDSIDYHMRRLKADRKSRRSSFMTTISHMLGRKD
ncbi:hypothetical protein GGF46_005382 [Coemansia sp. RSA 552]|nr:hypothetical protein GGF46_005382 [Coemansia sp. RSA 552]